MQQYSFSFSDFRTVSSALSLYFQDFDLCYAKRSYDFWTFVLGLTLIGALNTAITFHVVSIFGEVGYTKAEAVAIFYTIAIIATAGSLLGGWLSDYFKLKYFLIMLARMLAISCARSNRHQMNFKIS